MRVLQTPSVPSERKSDLQTSLLARSRRLDCTNASNEDHRRTHLLVWRDGTADLMSDHHIMIDENMIPRSVKVERRVEPLDIHYLPVI